MRYTLGFLMAFTGAALHAQVSAPVLGFVPDSGSVRPVFGIPAAASIAARLPISRGISLIATSPRQDYSLAVAGDNGEVVMMAADGTLTSLKGVKSSPDQIAISPEGSAAVLWFSSISHAQVIGGLPKAPSIHEIDASFIGLSPYSLSVSDDGQWFAGAWRSGNYAFGPHGEVNRLPVEAIVPAVAFMHSNHDLIVATHEEVIRVGDVGGANQPSTIVAGQGAALPQRLDAMAVAVAPENRSVIIADPRGHITQLDLTTGATVSADCYCHPQGLFPMGHAAYRLNGLDTGAFQLFDADTGQVLAAPLSSQEVQQ